MDTKYEKVAEIARVMSEGEAVVLVVVNGKEGTGYAVHADGGLNELLPSILRRAAKMIEPEEYATTWEEFHGIGVKGSCTNLLQDGGTNMAAPGRSVTEYVLGAGVPEIVNLAPLKLLSVSLKKRKKYLMTREKLCLRSERD